MSNNLDELKDKCLKKIKEQYGTNPPLEVTKRLTWELHEIELVGLSDTMFQVSEFCAKLRKQGILVGAWRSSVVSSAVAYWCEISEIDPIQHHLYFERFLYIATTLDSDLSLFYLTCENLENQDGPLPPKTKVYQSLVLTAIAETMRQIQYPPELATIALNDDAVFSALNCDSKPNILIDVIPLKISGRLPTVTSFVELRNIIAIYRPGPLEWYNDFQSGDSTYIELASHIFRETRGVPLFREQMAEAIVFFSGCSLLEAFQWLSEAREPNSQKRKELTQLISRKLELDMETASDLLMKILYANQFADTKNSATGMALLVYRLTWLKVLYPEAFIQLAIPEEWRHEKYFHG